MARLARNSPVFRHFSMIAFSSSAKPVIVVGAGPAGATAARVLAAAGIPVRLLDRAAFPRNKPCGGGLSLRILKRFPALERELPRIPTQTFSRFCLEGPGGESTVIESDGPVALMIRRVEFDALLVSLAVEAGAELVSGADIVHAREHADGVTLCTRGGRRFEASVVVAADGVHSVVARRLGLNPGWAASAVALDMMEESPRDVLRETDPSTVWVAYGFNLGGSRPVKGTNAPEGYAYVFPKRDHVNVGIGYVLSHYRQAIDAAPYELQRRFIGRLRDRGLVAGESMRTHFTPFLIPVGGPLRAPARGRVLLAGDAGGFVNGVTAEGIYYAMVSGDLAAKAVLGPGGVSTVARRYRRACDYEIGAELQDSVLVQRYLFADRRRIARIIAGAHREQVMTQLILDFAAGRRSYRDLRRRLLARSPWLAGRMVWGRLAGKTVVESRRAL
jgi:geranylgeranyl reductase family protein